MCYFASGTFVSVMGDWMQAVAGGNFSYGYVVTVKLPHLTSGRFLHNRISDSDIGEKVQLLF